MKAKEASLLKLKIDNCGSYEASDGKFKNITPIRYLIGLCTHLSCVSGKADRFCCSFFFSNSSSPETTHDLTNMSSSTSLENYINNFTQMTIQASIFFQKYKNDPQMLDQMSTNLLRLKTIYENANSSNAANKQK